MNNTYRKFFKVLRAWWMTLMLFAFIPMANAQTITSVVADADDYPGAEVVVTMNVLGFTAHATYNYYVVYNYEDYDKILQFTHNQTTDIVKTLDGAGDGTIVITADVPVELYNYDMSDLTVLVVGTNGALVYQSDAPVVPGSTYPIGGSYFLPDMSFADYDYEDRIYYSSEQFDPASPFYEFDGTTQVEFTIRRINSVPAVESEILFQYKKGTGSWTTIGTALSLNDAGGPGLDLVYLPADLPVAIIGKDISLRLIQTDGEKLSSGIDIWSVEDFRIINVLGEPAATSDYSPIFNGAFFAKDVIAYDDLTVLDDFTVLSPSFSIASITPPAAGFYPGEVVTYNILSGANVNFPAATIFEVYLMEVGGAGREVLLGNFPLSGGTGLPAAGANRDFTFNTPFLPGDWNLYVRADLRDGAVVAVGPAPFTILPVNLTATIDYDATAAAGKFELDGNTYLYPGSTVHVDYALGLGETINTANLNVQIALDYNDGDGWVELKSQAFSMTPASQTINAALPTTLESDFIDLRLRLVYGTQVDLLTAYVDRDWDNWGYGGNTNELPYYQFAGTTIPTGSKLGFHIFAVNNTAQSMVIEYTDDDQPVWTSLGTISTLLTDNKFVSHFASATNNISAVPTGLLSVENPMYRIRWADGSPLGTNIALYKGVRFQIPNELNVVSNEPSLGILYPNLQMSDRIAADTYIFPDTLGNVIIDVHYSKWKINAAAQIAVVLLEEGDNPMVDPYLYLGSKAAGAGDGVDSIEFTVDYEDIKAVFGDLPQEPDAPMEFDVWILLTDKLAAEPVMFKTEDFVVGWKENYDEQPMMITEAIDLTGLNAPVYLSYNWIVNVAPNPMNDLTRPVMEYTIDEGITWTKIDQHDFTTMFQIDTIDDLMGSTMARFRWTQTIELGDWDVQNVKILSGEDNLVTYYYGMTDIPQEIEMVLAEEEVPPVVDPCEDFNNASLSAYEFTTEVTSVNVGEPFEFDWKFLGAAAKAIVDQELTTDDQYVLGENTLEFMLDFDSDKKITQFVMTFPANVVPSAAEIIEYNDGTGINTLTPTISTSARTVTYASAAGAILNGPVYFDVTFGVDATVSDTIDVAFTITDADGTLNGICEIAPALAFPEGTAFYFYIRENAKDNSKVINAVFTVLSAEFTTGTQNLNFRFVTSSPDAEWIDGIRLTFPAGVTINSGSAIGTLPINIVGQSIEWGTFPVGGSGFGDLTNGTRDFSVNVTIDPSVDIEAPLAVDWLIHGDHWGAPPHITTGTGYVPAPPSPFKMINPDGEPYYITTENFIGIVPDYFVTGSYDLYVMAKSTYEDDKGVCQTTKVLVYEDLFVINDQTPEVYQIEITEVNYDDETDDYYWGEDVDVNFTTFGPWQDFEDLRFEVQFGVKDINNALVVLEESFEAGIPAGWLNIDNDGDTYAWQIKDASWEPVDGESLVASHSWISGPGALTPDNYLVTPQIDVEDAGYVLSFWVKGQDPDWPAEKYSVLVSTTGTAVANFTEELLTETLADGIWKKVTLSLADFEGESIYIAFRHWDSSDNFAIAIDHVVVQTIATKYINAGSIAHVEDVNEYTATITIPTFEWFEDMGYELNIDGEDIEVRIVAFQGTEDEEYVPGELIEVIDEFYAYNGTEEETTPMTFDVENVLRYAISDKLPLEGLDGQEIYLEFTYSADITAPNYLTLPVLQVTMDNGLTYTDINVPGSAFESVARLDANVLDVVYRYQIEDEYMTDDTRFRWYQEVPDGVWSIDNISVTLLTNEVPVANYYINDPLYYINVKQPVIPEFCDQFDPASLAGYFWGIEEVDEVTGFEAPVYVGEEFAYVFEFDEESGLDQLPDETEFMFYINKFASTFDKSNSSSEQTPVKLKNSKVASRASSAPMPEFKSQYSANIPFSPKEASAQWIHWDDGIFAGSVGLGAAAEWYSFTKFMPEDLTEFDGFAVSRVALGVGGGVGVSHVVIWQGPDMANLVEVYSQEFTPVDDSWNEVILNEPYEFNPEEELWIGVLWNDLGTDYPAGKDASTDADGIGNLLVLDGSLYYLTDFGIAGDWSIQAYVEPALIPLNIDGLPVTILDGPFTGIVPDNMPTGIYEVMAQAKYSEITKDTNSCNFGFRILKTDLLIINNDSDPEDVHYLTLDNLYEYGEDEEGEEILVESTDFVVGSPFVAEFSTYGPWPEDMNFALVVAGEVLEVGQETGEGIQFDEVHMPFIPPASGALVYTPDDGPGQLEYGSNTWLENQWTEIFVEERGYVGSVELDFSWDTDTWASEGSLWMMSPAGTTVQVAAGSPDGTYSIVLNNFTEEFITGNWRIWVQDSYGDGGHYIYDVTLTINAIVPVNIYAYFGEELLLGDTRMDLYMDEFEKLGYDENDMRFDMEGDRWAVSPVMDLSDLDPTNTKIWFDYTDINVTPSVVSLPLFQISDDGGATFTTLYVLDETDQYSASIGAYISATTQFRWVQDANFGQNQDMWNVSNVVITSGDDNIYFRSNTIPVNIIIPQVDVDYYFEIPLDDDGLEPAIYAGEDFDYIWDVIGDEYPEGTIFTIELHDLFGNIVIDNLTGEEVVFQNSDEVGLLSATAPIVDRGTYLVYVIASYDGYIYDEEYVWALNIYNPVIRTNLVGLDIPYAGGFASFEGTLESNYDQTLNDDYYYNLILEDGGDEWLLAVNDGDAEFNDVMLPQFISGMYNFKIQASTNGPLGVVGTILDNSFDTMLDAGPTAIADETDPGQREWEAYEMEDYDVNLADFVSISFDVYFSEEMANLTEAQHMILEYSIDGGKSYTEIHTYPDERFADEIYFDGDWFMEEDLLIPEAAKVEGTIIRFRIQETKGDVSLRNVMISADRTIQNAPYFALVSEFPVAKQRVEILGADALSYCNTDDIELTYNIRGSFGQFVIHSLYANDEDTELRFAGVTEGTGTIVVPGSVLDAIGVSGDVVFRLDAEDETYDEELGITVEVTGDESDFVEVVAKIDEETDVDALNDYSCDVAERYVVVEDPQDYFVYQARNAVTLENLSEAIVYDPEDLSLLNLAGDFVLPIGVVAERIIVEVVVTAQTKDGSLVCETLVLDDQIVFDVRNLALQYKWSNNEIGGVWMDMPETPGDFIICYNSTDLQFRLWDYSADGGEGAVVSADIKWYRDNTQTPVGSAGTLANFPLTGEYFAVVTSEFCDEFSTTPVVVTVELAPEKPIIEFIGEQEFCEGGHASLQVPANYAHYRWYIDGAMIEGSDMNMIDIYQSGYYEVEVSNYAFDPFVPVCTQFSDGLDVTLNIHEKPYIPPFTLVDDDLCEPMPAQIRVDSYEDDVWYQAYVWETGEATGVAKLGYEDGDPIILETDVLDHGVKLGIMAWRMGVDMCDPVYSTDVYEVKVYNLTIEVSGNVLIASLAPYDNQVTSYQWYRNNVIVQNGGTSRTLTIYDEATYSVKVMTYDGCILMATVAKDDEDPTDVVPSGLAVNMYPNPVQDNLTLKLDGDYLGNIQVRIINLAGVVIYDLNADKTAVEFEQVISVDNLTQGVYIIQITGGEYSEVKRFIKK